MQGKSKKRSKKRSNNSAQTPKSPTAKPPQNNFWIYAGLVLSTALLIAVYFGTQPATPESISGNSKLAVSSKPEKPAALATDPPKSSIESTPAAPLVLPKSPRPFETKPEQDRLLARVEKAIAEYPNSASALHVAAVTYGELLQTDKAATYFAKSLELSRNSPQVFVDYADLLMKTGKQQAAADLLLEPASAPTASPQMLETLGKAYIELGELDKAASTLNDAVTKFPNEPALRLALAQTQLQLQQFESAEKNARQALELGRTDNATYTALSSALIRLGRREEALKVRAMSATTEAQTTTEDEKYLASFKKFASHTYGMLANVYRSNRQAGPAEECLLESIAIDPNSPTSHVALADVLYQQKRAADAIAVYQRVIELQPENIYNYNNLASLAVATNNVPLAEDSLRRAAKVDPTGNATLRLADFLMRLGKLTEAATLAESAVKQLGNADAYLVWISALRADGKTTAAMGALLKAREAIPNDPRLKNIQL